MTAGQRPSYAPRPARSGGAAPRDGRWRVDRAEQLGQHADMADQE